MANLGGLFNILKRKDKKESRTKGNIREKEETTDIVEDKGMKEIEQEFKYLDSKTKNKICIDGIALLLLTKMGIIENAINFYNIILTPSLVEEIEKQKKDNEPEANFILNLINTGKFSKEKVDKNKDLIQYGLYMAELEIVSHFLNGNCNFILSDDAIIRANREILKLNAISTPAFVLSLLNKEIITREHAISAYAILRSEKWFEEWIIDECIRRVKLKK
ncbi:MAG: hypothetical protein GW779_00530 [Candidatus Altiarchaeum hamiconexum]|uniref:PIN domain-containing protein n=1 Tax=Candidatus Altarchaeum hamiconexum TaxID=1803513 RepID=A0A8J7YXD4_9ARCH|nr:hypothetical protein [Candidatus Altarchaeum hamiconexum]OIQ05875.1 MAG: hypothetical protein AUK59_02095 [Candidatus Altarchaeum sp. CG2_30_32_3053]PIV27898.1 MAG: hypothetical protein COS36_04170 [Candidatus Altarchaeum sp. CG03_land_8_20_14_0_80_32_618]PIX48345.1 MAG: hypothetical protein COZ53_04265 [Candidatus Altarchaeum sp. CG_4_8_14_3_um_filter_33_2054]PIZ29730.1 MAG: hypothetical protein COY41_05115 [Candidatus Altarchaeum sp. CG_4_10_14_0_8_um_filter_32_851]PJC13723.1 MAG: hypothe